MLKPSTCTMPAHIAAKRTPKQLQPKKKKHWEETLGRNIVRQLIQALQCEGHNITTDNFSLADHIAGEAKESNFGWYYSY